MKRVLITGSEGTIGKVLTGHTIAEGLHPKLIADITRLDINPERGSELGPDTDWRGASYNRPEFKDHTNFFMRSHMKDRAELQELLGNHDVVIHAAWSNEGILDPESFDQENIQRAQRLMKAAAAIGGKSAPRLILLSSVNAHVPENWRERREQGQYISVDEIPTPLRHNRNGNPGPGLTRYGASKLMIERMARDYADNFGLDIIVPRLGGVNMADKASSQYEPHLAVAASERGKHFDLDWEDAVRLSHADLVTSFQQLIDTPKQPGTFQLINLVSDTPLRVHEI